DPYAAPPQLTRYSAELAAPQRPLRIGFATRHLSPEGTVEDSHPDCVAAVARAAALLADLGHHVEPAEIETLRDPSWIPSALTVWLAGVTTDLDAASAQLGRPIEAHEVEVLTWATAELGRLIPAAAYTAAWRWLHRASRRV